MEDREIIGLFFAREERAIEETAQKYGAACMQTALRISGSRQDAEECVNDALLVLWRTIPPKNPDYLAAYLLGTVRHLAVQRVRHDTRQKRGSKFERLLWDDLEPALPAEDDVSGEVDRRLLAEAIGDFLSSLTAQQQALFVKRYYLCRTPQEIAQELQLSGSYVRVTLMRLKNRLQTYLEGRELL